MMRTPYSFRGTVVHGEKVGRTIGFPTANLDFLPEIKNLSLGVYFGEIELENKRYFCLAYFGPRYIFGEEKNNFELYIFDFQDEIYGKEIQGTLQHFLRKPKKMSGLQALQSQLEQDVKAGKILMDRAEKKIA